MITVSSYPIAVLMCFITMICWGSWGNTQKLASKEWKFQLFYWDYTVGMLLFALLMAFTMGSMGSEGRSFLADLSQTESKWIYSALVGGAVFNLSNILLVIAIDIAGLAVAFPIGVGLSLVIGVVANYDASQYNTALFALGVGLVVFAIVINAIAFAIKGGSAGKGVVKGIFISILAGALMGFFYKFVADAMTGNIGEDGKAVYEAGKMTSYSAMVIFALGVFLSNFVFNTLIMYFPVTGEKVNPVDYFTKGTSWLHFVGILGGAIWCLGTSFNFLASTQAGVSLSWGLGQGATMVSAFWGVFIWKEFKGASKTVNALIALMFVCFIAGLAVLIGAK